MAVVAPPDDQPLRAEEGEHAGRQRHLGGPLPLAEVDRAGQFRQLLAECRRGQPRPVGEPVQNGLPGGLHPRLSVGGQPTDLGVLGGPATFDAGHPGRGAPPGRGQQLAGEHEQGPAHGELLDQRACVVERAVDVGHRQVDHPRVQREVDGGRLGGVQHRHRPGGRQSVGDPVRRRDRVPPGETSAPLVVAEVPHVPIRPRRPARARWLRAGRRGSRTSRAGQPSKQGPSNSYSDAVGPEKKSSTMLTPVGADLSTLLITDSRKTVSLGSPERLPASSGSMPS